MKYLLYIHIYILGVFVASEKEFQFCVCGLDITPPVAKQLCFSIRLLANASTEWNSLYIHLDVFFNKICMTYL